MTKDDVIRLATHARLPHNYDTEEPVWLDRLTEFAKLVAEHEREACAKVCDETLAQHYMRQMIPARDESLLLAACADCAAAILARGQA